MIARRARSTSIVSTDATLRADQWLGDECFDDASGRRTAGQGVLRPEGPVGFFKELARRRDVASVIHGHGLDLPYTEAPQNGPYTGTPPARARCFPVSERLLS